MRTLIPALFVPLLFLTGCQVWLPGGSTYTADKNAFSVAVPAGWTFTTKAVPTPRTDLIATKDGVFLQRLLVEHHPIKDPLPNSKRSLTTAMSPFEIAEAVVDDLRSQRSFQHFEVNENTPATVGGRPGFRLLLQYQTSDKLRLTEIRYGTLVGENLHLLRFVAPTRHYFERDRAAAEEAARSWRVPAS
ncbi:MAG: hypothetical protein HZC55_12730 [Verrucomicrobia bacterium]|nr:hypothetical protein [Verrucomicrobiota bacterium]